MAGFRLGSAACVVAAVCLLFSPSAQAYLAFPTVVPNEAGKMDCWHTCATADYYGDGPHAAVDGGNSGAWALRLQLRSMHFLQAVGALPMQPMRLQAALLLLVPDMAATRAMSCKCISRRFCRTADSCRCHHAVLCAARAAWQ